VYQTSLANVDWLHGASEMLLTCTNLYIGVLHSATLAVELMVASFPPNIIACTIARLQYPSFHSMNQILLVSTILFVAVEVC
jgi:hypothetical protein